MCPGSPAGPPESARGGWWNEPVSTLDLFPTLVALTGAVLPSRRYDGQDIS